MRTNQEFIFKTNNMIDELEVILVKMANASTRNENWSKFKTIFSSIISKAQELKHQDLAKHCRKIMEFCNDLKDLSGLKGIEGLQLYLLRSLDHTRSYLIGNHIGPTSFEYIQRHGDLLKK